MGKLYLLCPFSFIKGKRSSLLRGRCFSKSFPWLPGMVLLIILKLDSGQFFTKLKQFFRPGEAIAFGIDAEHRLSSRKSD